MSKRIGLAVATAAFLAGATAALAQSPGGSSGSGGTGSGSLGTGNNAGGVTSPTSPAVGGNVSPNPGAANPGSVPNTTVLSGGGRRTGTTGAAPDTPPPPSSACGPRNDPRTGGGLGPQIQIDATVKPQC